ncbi:ankyrin repeat-containing domain protein [Fusarium redolens]|uniref:Ankyrin repeat-containing domain protein n=1 Tax=Fusarium redolens TaxID=48865 RepID=A0A9P9G1H3_FUSRE|nr:ankyrin repeat-containing domain protein [Fusarium redolens]KAH7230568.1 ankyrin repeat-containing domain protein [Fusarium redolens]
MADTLKDQLITLASTGDADKMITLLSTNKEAPSQETIQEVLTAAAKSSQFDAVRFLLAKYRSIPLNEEIVRAAVNTGSIPLMQALVTKDPSVINMQFDMRGTPLVVACMGRQHIDFLRFLLEAGADPNQDPDAAAYPLALVAGLYKDTAAIDLLLQYGAKIEQSGALGAAARRGNEPMMRYLLDKGARPESDATSTGAGASPLHVAVKAGHVGVARILMQHGADPNATDASGTSAIELAKQLQQEGKATSEMVEALEGK